MTPVSRRSELSWTSVLTHQRFIMFDALPLYTQLFVFGLLSHEHQKKAPDSGCPKIGCKDTPFLWHMLIISQHIAFRINFVKSPNHFITKWKLTLFSLYSPEFNSGQLKSISPPPSRSSPHTRRGSHVAYRDRAAMVRGLASALLPRHQTARHSACSILRIRYQRYIWYDALRVVTLPAQLSLLGL